MEENWIIANFAWNLRRLRKKAGLSQTELGRCAGYGQSHVSRWESGKIMPGLHSLLKIAERLQVTLDHMLFYPDRSPARYCSNPLCLLYVRLRMADKKLAEAEVTKICRLLGCILDFLLNRKGPYERQERFEILNSYITNLSRTLRIQKETNRGSARMHHIRYFPP